VDTSLDLIVPPDPNTAYDIKEVITRVVDEVRFLVPFRLLGLC
jgi:acetyl-CoA carboxylase carboxyltransferase component